jgi:hypothetical protein
MRPCRLSATTNLLAITSSMLSWLSGSGSTFRWGAPCSGKLIEARGELGFLGCRLGMLILVRGGHLAEW